MSRLLRSAAAGLLTAVLCLGMSTGPVLADGQAPTGPSGTVSPSPPETAPSETAPTETAPTETAPTETDPAEPGPTSSRTPEPTTTSSGSSAPVAPVVPAEPAAELADLRLRVWFDKSSYRADETIFVHAAVTNAGTATANKVVLSWTGNLDNSWWPPFDLYGVPIEPGQTVEGTTYGRLSTDAEAVRLVVTVRQFDGEPDADPGDNTVTVSVPVVIPRGSFRGTIYGDRDGDHVMDPGEALAGVGVHISGGSPHTDRTTTTDAYGVAVFRDLPAGSYYTFVNWYGSGWYVPSWGGTVDGVDDPDVLLRATPELSQDRLKASLAFPQASYRRGDIPRAVLSLHNTSTVLLTDLVADCDSADEGELTPGSRGATLRPGEKRDFVVTTAPIGDAEASTGYIRLYCMVSASGSSLTPGLTALARVPGGVAPRVAGSLVNLTHDPILGPPNGVALPGIKVYLRDQIDKKVVARAVTDANGLFSFYNVPAGPYHLGVVGPWRLYYGEEFVVRDGENGYPSHYVVVRPGPDQPDPDAVPPGGTPPGGGPPPDTAPPGGTPELAATGTGAARLALSGLLTLLIGAGLVLLARQGPNGPGSRRT
ncbi:hypothetical protein SK571_22540 [Lentzea sp. BCCO 10_0798]|uniref:Alpha-amylase n=1 Tax=Lentzea kristufekii TaxID=3095430 RepID=A0ABU4TV35_9PSEU|nr:hypothetical protein [Lentzea sp. BCCO 10_0798]MDX8052174.1 hypothetical protein [Lentzea sp. BCCO 10_0798]